jgi:Domain of unknown function (DUF1929)/Carbohydrate binding module (family 6)
MTVKINIRNSSLAVLALMLSGLLTACPPPPIGTLEYCNATTTSTDVSAEGAIVQAEDYKTFNGTVERRQPVGGVCSLRAKTAGDSGEYTLKVAQSSDFDVAFKINSEAVTKLHLELDGNPVDGTNLEVPANADPAQEFTVPVLTLPEGDHQLRVVIDDLNGASAVMIDEFKLKKPSLAFPYLGQRPSIPFTLEAEHFDRGGQPLVYSDSTPGNSGTGSRISNVDIDVQGNKQLVTSTQPGEYLKYSFTVPESLKDKNFRIAVWYSSLQGGGKFSLSLGGVKVINQANVDATGSSTSFTEETSIRSIAPGARSFTLYFDSLAPGAQSVMNVDRIEVSVDSNVEINLPPTQPAGVIGQTSQVYNWPLMPIHAALMPNGTVYSWGGGADFNVGSQDLIWDPSQGGTPTRSPGLYLQTNLFCAGFSHLPDGRLLVVGGHWDNFVGVPEANIFDSKTQAIAPTTSMYAEKLPNAIGTPRGDATFDPTKYYKDPKHTGRWYPSTTPLPNGEIMVSEGYSSILSVTNNVPEIWKSATGAPGSGSTAGTGGWRSLDNTKLTSGGEAPTLSYYPFMYPRPNNGGEVVRVGPEPIMYAFKTDGTGSLRKLNTRPDNTVRDYGSAAMFEPGKVLLLGGNGGDGALLPPRNTAVVIDITTDQPSVTSIPNMAFGRRHATTTILPTGDVLVSGGSSGIGHNAAPYVFPMEIFNATTKTFRTVANTSNKPRGYHSIALLLPDARVMIGGGGNCGGCQPDENNIEIYEPPYLYKPNGSGGQIRVPNNERPNINSITNAAGTSIDTETSIGYNQILKINTTASAGKTIARVSMIKLGAVTHTRNFDQNFHKLSFYSTGSDLTVTTPTERAWATPGHYMIFAIDSDGVPSDAKIIKVQ